MYIHNIKHTLTTADIVKMRYITFQCDLDVHFEEP